MEKVLKSFEKLLLMLTVSKMAALLGISVLEIDTRPLIRALYEK